MKGGGQGSAIAAADSPHESATAGYYRDIAADSNFLSRISLECAAIQPRSYRGGRADSAGIAPVCVKGVKSVPPSSPARTRGL